MKPSQISNVEDFTKSLNDVTKIFGITFTGAELSVFIQHINRKFARGETFPSIVEVFDCCNEDIFPNVQFFLKALITLPMTTCSVERLFSSVNRIKTASRSSMLTARLNSLRFLTFESNLADSLDYDEVINIFKTKPCRLLL